MKIYIRTFSEATIRFSHSFNFFQAPEYTAPADTEITTKYGDAVMDLYRVH